LYNNISDIDKQKRKFSSDISELCKLLNADLDKIEKQKVEEMVSEEQHVQEFVLIVMFGASVLYR
jgi:hypothetical protein